MVPTQPVVSCSISWLNTKCKYENEIGTGLAQHCLTLSLDFSLWSIHNFPHHSLLCWAVLVLAFVSWGAWGISAHKLPRIHSSPSENLVTAASSHSRFQTCPRAHLFPPWFLGWKCHFFTAGQRVPSYSHFPFAPSPLFSLFLWFQPSVATEDQQIETS